MEILGVAFCGPCAREQEAYFAIGELADEEAQESALVLAEASGATLGEMVMLDYSFVEVRTRRFSYAHRLRGHLLLREFATARPRPCGKRLRHNPLALADAGPSSWAALPRRRSW